MKKILLLLIIISGSSTCIQAQQTPNWVSTDLLDNPVFIENKGQFAEKKLEELDGKIMYYARKGKMHLYFLKDALVFRCDSSYHETDQDKEPGTGGNEEGEEEEQMKNLRTIPVFMKMNWAGANATTELEVREPVSNFFTYGDLKDGSGRSGIVAHAWKKLVYRNIYNGIDIEFYFPEEKGGIEYNIIVHPGADPANIRMTYSDNARIILADKNINIFSPCADFTDHMPTAKDENENDVPISFSVDNNSVSFQTAGYDHSQTLIIDPWITTTKFAKKNSAYDIAFDILGNVYVYGGYTPYQECKYSGSGTLLWTYTTTFPYLYYATGQGYYGDLEVDKKTGMSYMCEGYNCNGGQGPQVVKVDPNTGKQVALYPGTPTFDEMWRLRYDYCDHLLVIAGGNNFNQIGNAATLDSTCTKLNFQNVLGANSGQHDMCLLSIPTDVFGKCYMGSSQSNVDPNYLNNVMVSVPLPKFLPTGFQVPDNHNFPEIGGQNGTYTYYPVVTGPPIFQAAGNGFNGMASNIGMVCTYDGSTLRKWRPSSGTFVKSINLGGKAMHSGGLDIDCQGHIYAGFEKSIRVYDSLLNYLGSIPLKDTVYDLRIGISWNVYSCGRGFVESDKMIFLPAAKQITVTKTSTVTCNSCDGTANAVANFCEGFPPFTYSWSNGKTSQTITGLCPGSYTVTVRDTSTCNPQRDTAIVVIYGPTASFTSTPSHTDNLCFGDSKGVASVTLAGGTPPYSYLWKGGQTTSSISSLPAGTYTVAVGDNTAGGCPDSIKITITEPPVLKMKGSGSPATCHGNCNGQASVIPSGGTSPYTYSWSNSSTGASLNNLCAQTYSVTLTDLNGCKHDTTITIAELPKITDTKNTTPAICGLPNGSATVTAGGGTPGFTYSWNNGKTTSVISNVAAGSYTVIIKDSKGCKDTVPVIVPGGSAFTDAPANVDVLCFGDKNGSATITTTGGVSPYTYSWKTGETTNAISGLGAGTYTCVVKDNGGNCADTVKITITQPPQLLNQSANINVTCHSNCDGSATATPSGGTSPYVYSWTNSGTGANITALCAGGYTVNITDKNSCTQTGSVTITEPPAITYTPTITPTTCGQSNGSAAIAAGGGTPGYTYSWTNGGITASSISNVAAGNYSVIIKDSKGCPDTVAIIVPNSAPFTITTTPSKLLCFGDKNGTLSVTVNGNSAPYTYDWSNGATTGSLSNLNAGVYSVNIKDVNGCVGSVTDTVKQPTLLTLQSTGQVICKGDPPVTLNALSTGGTTPYTYVWDNSTTAASYTVTPSATTVYTLVTTDANGCTKTTTDTIVVIPVPQAAFSGIDVCVGIPTTFKDSSYLSAGQPAGTINTWTWNFGDGTSSASQNPVHTYSVPGTYTVTLSVSIGPCKTTIDHVVNVYPVPKADFDASPQPTTILNTTITFRDLSSGGTKGAWDLGDGSTDVYIPGVNPVHTYPDENIPGGETFKIKLGIINQYGCPDTISKLIHIDPEWTFYVPNTFTPNGDGKNDLFFGTGIGIIEKEMWIFDRWGNQIFHTKDLYGGWDGKVQSGNELNPGGLSNEVAQEDTYVWLIIIKEVYLKTHRYIGHVNIVK